MSFYNEKIETMPRESLKKLQGERLVAQVKRSYEKVQCFRERMDEAGLTPDDIHGIEDISKLPFSYKKDLRDYYPYGLFAQPLENIVRVHASSGTTGKRIVVGYTQNDIDMWSECVARMLKGIGVGKNDIVQISFGYGLFTGGFGAHSGAETVGATVIPMSSGNTALQIQTMIDFGTTVLFCTPSYAMYLAEEVERMGVKDQLKLRVGVFGAEPWSEDLRRKIEDGLGIKAYDIYGLSEVMGPGVSCECEYQNGMHVWEDNFIVEIINPDTGEVLPEGSTGELVFTSLTKEAFPVIRYRTRDICSLITEPCKCGRTHIRMQKPSGRSDDMLIIRGVNVFPSQIEEVLLKVSGQDITPNYQIIVGRVNNTDTSDINVEMSEAFFTDDIKSIKKLENTIVEKLRSMLGIGAKVHLVNPKSIVRSEGKAKRVIDNRNGKI
ncbi:MAG: phenylacetate--CoA ligase [Oscillospiraceae bacterium]|nr:phenylacetate--CoA ligase [Candidatus Equicaccousia limihippi]